MARGTTPPSKVAAASSTHRIQQRKPSVSQKLNTNLSAHPRTDPINALSVLLKLLTSLPGRIGGCQYKLTPAEHALSLHLVNVLDPYVYHGARALAPNPAPTAAYFGLVDQPTEILDAILFHVDTRRDLLNAGLVCKRLHDVVFPRHFEYRAIRCKVSSISVWNHLILHRSLARNVRRVEILDERSPTGTAMLIPRGILQGDTDLESTDDELVMHAKQERFLAKALMRMTGLKEFKWSCNHSPLSIAQIWPTLMMRAANLKSINICDNLVFSPRSEVEDTESESDGASDKHQSLMSRVPDIALLDMESVTFKSTSHIYGSSKNPDLERITAMLHQCVNLKELDVTYISPRITAGANGQGITPRTRPLADEFLTYGRWSKLTCITLSNLRSGSGSFLNIATFLTAHPTLEVLNIDISIPTSAASTPFSLPPGSLPRLREVKASKEIINAILQCPTSTDSDTATPRPLDTVKGFRLSGHSVVGGSSSAPSRITIPDAVFLSNLRAHAGSLRRVELAGWHEMDDIKRLAACVPQIQHLDIGRRFGSGAALRASAASDGGANNSRDKGLALPVGNTIEWMDLLATLPELVVMHGVKFFYGMSSANPSMMERSRMRKNDEIAGMLAWKCRKLRRVDHWDAESGGRVIVLLRESSEENGARWEVRRVK